MKKKLSRRDFLGVAAGVTAGTFLAACAPAAKPTVSAGAATQAPQGKATVPPKENITLNFWNTTDLIWTDMMTKFGEQNPGLKVNLTELGGNEFGGQKYLAAVAAGTGPDATYQNRHTFMQFSSKKMYRDLTSMMDAGGVNRADFTPVQIAETTWDGKIYGLPHVTDVRYLYWNKKHFTEAGLDPTKPPTTWDELEQYTEKLTQKDAKGNPTRFGFVPYLFGNSWTWLYGFLNRAPAISDDKKTILCDDPRWTQVVDWMVKFYDKYVGSFEIANSFSEGITSAGLGDPFAAGKVSMTASGDWQVGDFLRVPDLDWDCAPMPLPQGGVKSTWSCGFSMVVAPDTKHADEAFKLCKWTVTEDGWKARAEATKADTARVWAREKITGDPKYWPTMACHVPSIKMLETTYVSQLSEREKKAWAMGLDALQNWTHGCGSEMGVAALEYWVEMDNATRAALSHKVSAEQAMADCKKKAQAAADKAWAAIS
jgi:ABC-type glycerol-3-phosphate transport system substrate-binding protein